MSINSYQKEAFTTAKPESQNINYMALGLAGEAGEVANKVKKVMRDGTELNVPDIMSELGDVLWYVAGMATILGISLADIAEGNLAKLHDRKQRGTLGGSGDNR